MLARAWHLDNLRITWVSRNIYVLFFAGEEDVRRVLVNGPWTMDNNLLVLTHWVPQLVDWDWLFENVEFWVQLHRLPSYAYTEGLAQKL